MSIFTPNYEKPGPGIPKNAPPKKGLALFFEILVREFWQLIKLNLIFVITCIPIITIGPATAGLYKSTIKMVRDVPNDVLDDFKTGFRENMRSTLLIGIAGILLLAGCYLGLMLYNRYFVLQILSIVVIILIINVGIYLFPLLTSTTLSVSEAIRNSFLLSIIRCYISLPISIFCAVALGIQILLFPLSIPISLFLGFSIPCFICGFAAWSGIKKYIIQPKYISESERE